jgi:hypothetical protein
LEAGFLREEALLQKEKTSVGIDGIGPVPAENQSRFRGRLNVAPVRRSRRRGGR